MIRRTITWFALGGLLGVAAAMWWGPSLMTWWWTPYAGAATVTSAASVTSLLRHFVGFELVVGGVAGMVTALLAHLIAHKRPPAPANAPATH